MNKDNNDIENLFSSAFREHRVTPDSSVLNNIRFSLWKRDFLSLDPTKFNFAYASLITICAILIPIALNNSKTANTINTEIQETALNTKLENSTHNTVIDLAKEKNTAPLEARATMANFSPSVKQGCAPLTVSFNDMSVAIESYSWDFGDGTTSIAKNPKHNYKKPGIYTATLIAKDKTNKTYTHKHSIRVLESPKADFELNVDKSDLTQKTVAFTNKSIGANKNSWDFGDNTKLESDTDDIAHTYSEFKHYTVSLIATSTLGCTDTMTLANQFIEENYQLSFPLSFRPKENNAANNGYYKAAVEAQHIFYPINQGVDKYQLKVFAPNGTNIFTSNNINQGWNGYFRGKLAPSGVYVYESTGTYPNGQAFTIKSKVKVIVDSYQDNY